jgi:cell division protein FtsI/penicillin-binding protein 2
MQTTSLQQEALRRRLPVVIIVLVMVSALLLLRLVLFQLPQDPSVTSYIQSVRDANYGRTERTVAERGRIFDHNGSPLAVNTLQYGIGISPSLIVDGRRVATQLAGILGKDELQIFHLTQSNNDWESIARPVSADIGEKIAQLGITGVTIERIPRRLYPQGALAGQVIGFVAGDIDQARGYSGIEGYYQDQLAGRVRETEVSNIPFDIPQDQAPSDQGKDLYLTIDRDIQFLVESELQQSIDETGATEGTIIAMNPRTGEILAMASYPSFDPNNYFNISDQNLLKNPAISDVYEPGSVMKLLTIAGALEKGVITPDWTYNDQGSIEIGGRTTYNWDRQAHGVINTTQIIVQSLNVGAATVSKTMGPTNFYGMMSAFGIGKATSVDLEGEESGILKVPGDPNWSDSDLGTNAYGQGVSVTPLQMLTAVSAIANGGLMMQPHVVAKIVDGNKEYPAQPSALGRPISANTAKELSNMMIATVRDGVDNKALLPGYTIAGKTGTAEIPTPVGYEDNAWKMTFVGFLPADDPQVAVLIKLDRPKNGRWASDVTAPIFSRLAKRLVVLMKIPPDDVRHALAAQGGAVNNVQR